MEIEKVRNYSDEELVAEENKAAEQLFRLRFQLSTGQVEGVKKLRELKKDVARFKTIARARKLGLAAPAAKAPVQAAKAAPAKAPKTAKAAKSGKAAK